MHITQKYIHNDNSVTVSEKKEISMKLEINRQSARYCKLWGSVKPLESLQPYANPRTKYPVPNERNNESSNSKGTSSKFKSFSYIYNEEQFKQLLQMI
ncbi:hypothetical protein FRX31_023472 [Thalictrum thalictroides]|uniref:Uncharacterized protein n=1 Tax=Thalictrum thalictroides TaxID=46969 RepID=A0A7J6VQ83_THATH|nr:hypothetical protein FRX31_023472 [Thalictrum thalictroides]